MFLKDENSHVKMVLRCKNNITSFQFTYLLRGLFFKLHSDGINLNNYLIEGYDFAKVKNPRFFFG